MFSLKGKDPLVPKLTYFITSSDDCNVFLFNFDGIFIGKFGQDAWNLSSLDTLLEGRSWKEVDLERVNRPKFTDLNQLRSYVEKYKKYKL